MSDFDPYHKWLGIPETERPISKYRLLALVDFEIDREVISAAAEQRTIYLRTLQAGEHEVLVAQLLNEVSQARVTLLNADQKAEYDEELREQQTPEPQPEPTPRAIPVVLTPAPKPVVVREPVTQKFPVSVVQSAKRPGRTRQKKIWKQPAVIGISVVGVIGVFVLVLSLMFSGDDDPVASNTPPMESVPPIPRPEPMAPQPETPPTIPPQPEPEPETGSKPAPELVEETSPLESAIRQAVSLHTEGMADSLNPEYDKFAQSGDILLGLVESHGMAKLENYPFKFKTILYNAACAYSLDDDTVKSLAAYRLAMEFGWDDFDHATQDSDLEHLRESDGYQQYLKEQFQLGIKYYRGLGVTQDYKEAVKWFSLAAEQKCAPAQSYLGSLYYLGKGVAQNYTEAAKWYRFAAEQGDDFAQRELGRLYEAGKGVPEDYTMAISWFRKSSVQGNASAQNWLGSMYREGKGVTKNYTEAVSWFRKAANQGYAFAQNNLGYMYQNGKGVTQDYREAVSWFRKAADQGYADAQTSLGGMYRDGKGVPENYQEAAKSYRRAAVQGHAKAQYSLAYMYASGPTHEQFQEAEKWYKMAAEQGYFLAQCNLASMYWHGKGVPQDYKEAYIWYSIASVGGNKNAEGWRNSVKAKLFPAQITAAQEQAKVRLKQIEERQKR
jgi:TPR repeat protein